MTVRLKVLISAYACSPYKGSEPGVGWGFVSSLAQYHDLWVIVEEEKFRDDIERFLVENPEFADKVRFYFIRKQRNRKLRKLWPPSYYWYYRKWHKAAYILAQKLHAEVGFDLAHQLTMVGFREPGYLWRLAIPFVWGPIGGMGYFPWRFLPTVGPKGALYYLGYNCLNFLHTHFLRRPKQAAIVAANGLLAATPENQASTGKHWGCASRVTCEVGLPPGKVRSSIQPRQVDESLKLIWVGLHTYRKALNLALHALALVDQKIQWELHILGEGEKSTAWKALADQLKMNNRCFFRGWLPRHETLAAMRTSHVMLITSLRDLTSTVTIEALANGLPVICLDHCGFSHVVNDGCGIKVPLTTPKRAVQQIAAAIERLGRDETLRQQLAEGALARAADFTWEKKNAELNQVYEERIRMAEAGSQKCR